MLIVELQAVSKFCFFFTMTLAIVLLTNVNIFIATLLLYSLRQFDTEYEESRVSYACIQKTSKLCDVVTFRK